MLEDTAARTIQYVYDFEDDWDHSIRIERVGEATPGTTYPRLLKATGACPPEDVGGAWGYEEFLEALADPDHEQHEDMLRWSGGDFDPNDAGIDRIVERFNQLVKKGAPQAKQVADRFHIVQNLRMAIEEQMNLHGRATGSALLSDADNISTASNLLKSRLAHRKSREKIFKTIHALRQQGLTCSEIGRRTGFPRRSVAKWLLFETPPDRKRAVLERSSAWYFEEYLRQSWANGIRSGNELLSLIRERGYEGSLSNLRRLLAGWRRAEKQEQRGPIREHQILEPVQDPETGHAISPVIAAALCIKPRGKLTLEQARKVEALKAGSPPFPYHDRTIEGDATRRSDKSRQTVRHIIA